MHKKRWFYLMKKGNTCQESCGHRFVLFSFSQPLFFLQRSSTMHDHRLKKNIFHPTFFSFIKLNPEALSFEIKSCLLVVVNADIRTRQAGALTTIYLRDFLPGQLHEQPHAVHHLSPHLPARVVCSVPVPVMELSDSGSGSSASTARLRDPVPNLTLEQKKLKMNRL
jgi:hypothetical protein